MRDDTKCGDWHDAVWRHKSPKRDDPRKPRWHDTDGGDKAAIVRFRHGKRFNCLSNEADFPADLFADVFAPTEREPP